MRALVVGVGLLVVSLVLVLLPHTADGGTACGSALSPDVDVSTYTAPAPRGEGLAGLRGNLSSVRAECAATTSRFRIFGGATTLVGLAALGYAFAPPHLKTRIQDATSSG